MVLFTYDLSAVKCVESDLAGARGLSPAGPRAGPAGAGAAAVLSVRARGGHPAQVQRPRMPCLTPVAIHGAERERQPGEGASGGPVRLLFRVCLAGVRNSQGRRGDRGVQDIILRDP